MVSQILPQSERENLEKLDVIFTNLSAPLDPSSDATAPLPRVATPEEAATAPRVAADTDTTFIQVLSKRAKRRSKEAKAPIALVAPMRVSFDPALPVSLKSTLNRVARIKFGPETSYWPMSMPASLSSGPTTTPATSKKSVPAPASYNTTASNPHGTRSRKTIERAFLVSDMTPHVELTPLWHAANAVMDATTGASLNYTQLRKGPDGAEWIQSAANEIGRLAQGVGAHMPTGTDTIHFIPFSQIPN